ncbi:MAG: SoxR reducing system RseC family protein [candidate division KSB1 bacterium]|nr:SoxR reducing system RseC family protein [candidate division KSB1 bacterium]
MKKPGVVISINGDRAIVLMKHTYACSGEHAECPWNALLGNVVPREFYIEADNPISAKPGQMVEVEYPAAALTRNAFYVYLLPLLTMFVGFVVTYFLSPMVEITFNPEHIGYIGGGAGLIAGFFITKHLDKRLKEEYVVSNIVTAQIPACTGCILMQ